MIDHPDQSLPGFRRVITPSLSVVPRDPLRYTPPQAEEGDLRNIIASDGNQRTDALRDDFGVGSHAAISCRNCSADVAKRKR